MYFSYVDMMCQVADLLYNKHDDIRITTNDME